MFDPSPDLRLVAVLAALHLVDFTARAARALIREVARLRRFAVYQRLLARIGSVTVDPPLLAVQQLRERVLVMHVSRGEYRAVRQTALAVHTDICSFAPKYHCLPLRV